MLENISASQLNDWIDYFTIEPFDYQRNDYRSAVVAFMEVKSNTDSDISFEKFIYTFFPDIKQLNRNPQQQSLDEQMAIASIIANSSKPTSNEKGG